MEPTRRQLSRSSSRYQKTWQEKFKDFLRNLIAFMFTNVGIIGLVVGYTTGGAFMFKAIEESMSQENYQYTQKNRTKAVEALWDVTYKVNVFNHTSWQHDVQKILTDYQKWFVNSTQKGVDVSYQQWNFPGAFLYSLTVITTIAKYPHHPPNRPVWEKRQGCPKRPFYMEGIGQMQLSCFDPKGFYYKMNGVPNRIAGIAGYGNLSPRTDGGKLATVVYAIIGMPLFLLYLSNIGDILARCFKWGYYKMCLCRGCPGTSSFRRRRKTQDIPMQRFEPQQEQYLPQRSWQAPNVEEGIRTSKKSSPESEDSENEDSDEDDENAKETYDPQSVTVPITLCLAFMVWYVMVGAWLFLLWEDWGVLDGSYFCFISLSTIGFGDIVPGDKIYNHGMENLSVSFIATAVYLMLGMALIAMCFNLMQEEVIHKARTCVNACKNIFSCCRKNSDELYVNEG